MLFFHLGRSPRIQSSQAWDISQLAHQIQLHRVQMAGPSVTSRVHGFSIFVTFFPSTNVSFFLSFFFRSKILEHIECNWHLNPEDKCLNKLMGGSRVGWRGIRRARRSFTFAFFCPRSCWTYSVWHLKALVFWQSSYGRSNLGSNWGQRCLQS